MNIVTAIATSVVRTGASSELEMVPSRRVDCHHAPTAPREARRDLDRARVPDGLLARPAPPEGAARAARRGGAPRHPLPGHVARGAPARRLPPEGPRGAAPGRALRARRRVLDPLEGDALDHG